MDLIFSPPIAFLIYAGLVTMLVGFGRLLAGRAMPTPTKTSTYSSGEAPPEEIAAPGYRPYFVVALFFAILHLGALMLGTNNLSGMAIIYLIGLILALLALILG
jgi:NADH:ubiquinone oxidoreductase subunit 3 (subunit A)